MNIALQDFLDCVSYHYLTDFVEVPEAVAQAIKADDPEGVLCHIEQVGPVYKLYTRFGWDNELLHREYLVTLFKQAVAPVATPPKPDPQSILREQIRLAHERGDVAMANTLEKTLALMS
jgi:hypothetical protein